MYHVTGQPIEPGRVAEHTHEKQKSIVRGKRVKVHLKNVVHDCALREN